MSFVYYDHEQLKEILFYYNEESKIFLPNSIFDELKENIDIDQKKRGSEHIAYAYSYVYLISYLYRYAKYANHLFTENDLKKILQTVEANKHKAYITKKGGVLDQLDYIKKRKEFPVIYEYDYDTPEFTTNEEFYEEFGEETLKEFKTKLPKNHKINFPYRAFYLPNEEFYYEGYFYNIENTHMIPIEVFMFCMSKSDLGTLGFYLYAFLKHKTDLFPNGWDCSKKDLISLTGLKQTSLLITLKSLEEYNMIYNSHQPYYININNHSEELKLLANTYKAYDYKHFKTEKQNVVPRQIINLDDDYFEHIGQTDLIHEITDEEIDQLNT